MLRMPLRPPSPFLLKERLAWTISARINAAGAHDANVRELRAGCNLRCQASAPVCQCAGEASWGLPVLGRAIHRLLRFSDGLKPLFDQLIVEVIGK